MGIGTLLGGEISTPNEFDVMADACIVNHEKIVRHGSPEMQTASRMLLFALADEIRRRSSGAITTADNKDQPSPQHR